MMVKFLFFALLCLAVNVQANQSVYSAIDDKSCKTVETNTEGDYFISHCPGHNGYQVQIAGGDSRSWFVILKNKRSIYDSLNDISEHAPGNFANLASKVLEWRYDKAQRLVALIVRIEVQDSEREEKSVSQLMVFRHSQGRFCYLGMHKTNAGAREIADTSTAFCKP